jgi:hypothetical protein
VKDALREAARERAVQLRIPATGEQILSALSSIPKTVASR